MVVKLVITSACHAEGRGFESRPPRHFTLHSCGRLRSPDRFILLCCSPLANVFAALTLAFGGRIASLAWGLCCLHNYGYMKQPPSTVELEKAAQTLAEALQFAEQVKSDEIKFKIARDACIQRFEYCIELAWKVAMRKLGSTTKFAKPAIREMARANLIGAAEDWLLFAEARNQTSHSYDEGIAQKLFHEIQKFSVELGHLLVSLKNLP